MSGKIFFHVMPDDVPYLPIFKGVFTGKAAVHFASFTPTAIFEVVSHAKDKGCTRIATTSPRLLQLLLEKQGEKLPSVDDYAGSIIDRYNMEFLIVNPVSHLVTVPYGRFLYERYFSKFLHPERFLQLPEFSWELFDPATFDQLYRDMESATVIGVDIETGDEQDRVITCSGFTACWIDVNTRQLRQRTVVIPADSEYNVVIIGMLCNLHVPKVFQNGKYDIAYFIRYRIPPTAYAFDTINLFHSWYSELPKRLDFIVSFMLRKWQFWKDESSTQNLEDYYRYNAKDSYVTAMCLIALIQELPEYAIQNYLMEFPTVFPCILAEATGIRADREEMQKEEKKFLVSLAEQKRILGVMTGVPGFNPSSPKQVLELFNLLGSGDIKDTKPPSRDKVAHRHPLNRRLMTAIETYRKDRKLLGYVRDEDPDGGNPKIWHDRIFFGINPHGTDTGRLAGKKSQFWCGENIHQIPRPRKDIQIKRSYIADEGFYIGEADGEQAEARDTAYLSGDTALISAVDDVTRDFHSTNASSFFGLPYEDICSSVYDQKTGLWDHERLLVDIIDIAKRTNHGSNYNMGAGVMIDTMGIDNVLRAQQLLRLPLRYSLKQVTQFLLNKYAETYKIVKGDWYDYVVNQVVNTHLLVGPTGWTRYCFADPRKNKHALNSYVAHPPQSLNAMVLNKAYKRVFYEVWMQNQRDFKLGPQIHDSIKFQYRIGHEHLAWAVKKCMEIPTPVTDIFGIKRTLLVPVALKGGSTRWSDIKKLKA